MYNTDEIVKSWYKHRIFNYKFCIERWNNPTIDRVNACRVMGLWETYVIMNNWDEAIV